MNRKIERAKRFLNQYKTCLEEKRACEEKIIELRERQQAVSSPNIDGMPKGNKHVDLSDYIVRLEMLIEGYQEKEAYENKVIQEILKAIRSLDNTCEQEILRGKYIELKEFGQIAEEMDLTIKAVYHYHNRACEKLAYTQIPLL